MKSVLVTWFIATCFCYGFVSSQSCSTLSSINITVYVKWPYALKCYRPLDTAVTNSECLIYSGTYNNTKTYQAMKILDFRNSQVNQTYLYTLIRRYENGTCEKWAFFAKCEALPSLNIIEDALVHQNDKSDKYIYFMAEFRSLQNLNCINENTSLYYPDGDYTITWYHIKFYENGSVNREVENVNELHNFIMFAGGKTLAINVMFFDPGLYTCQIEYKKQKAFGSHTQFCVRQVSPIMIPFVDCIRTVVYGRGDSRNITCLVQMDSTVIGEEDLVATWSRLNNDVSSSEPICENRNHNEVMTINSNVKCEVKELINEEKICFDHQPHDDLIRPEHESVAISLELKDLKRWDRGEIEVRVRHFNRSSEARRVVLEYDFVYEYTVTGSVLSCLLALLLFIVFVFFCKWRFKIQLLLFVRRHFGKYDEDDKEYVAMLSYTIPDSSTDEFQVIKKLMKWTVKLLDDKGYSYYDSHRQLELGPVFETIINKLNKSHRLIVFLTVDYIKEARTRFETSQALDNMLKNRTKLIFVCCPGAKKFLKKSENVKFKSDMQKAVQAMRNVDYKFKMCEQEFCERLDYALPNLDHRGKDNAHGATNGTRNSGGEIASTSKMVGTKGVTNKSYETSSNVEDTAL